MKVSAKIKNILPFLNDDIVARQFFFQDADVTSDWYVELYKQGVFAIDKISKIQTLGENIDYPQWPEGDYLIRIVKDKPTEILTLVSSYNTATLENPIIKQKLLEIYLQLADHFSEEILINLFTRINTEHWFHSKFLNQMPYVVEDLIKKLIEKKYLDTVLALLPEVIRFIKTDRRDPNPVINIHVFFDILEDVATIKVENEKKDQLAQLIDFVIGSLSEYLKLREDGRTRKEDHSLIWKPILTVKRRLADDEREKLFDTLRDLYLNNIQLIKLSDVERLYKTGKTNVFCRLGVFILTKAPIDPNKSVSFLAKVISIPDIKGEIREYLKLNFASLKATNKVKILKSIEDAHDLDDFVNSRKKFLLKRMTAKELRSSAKSYLMKEMSHYLLPIKDYLEAADRKRLSKYLKLPDDFEQDKYHINDTVTSGPNSLISEQTIKDSSIPEILEEFSKNAQWFYVNQHNHGLYSPLGVARLWEVDIKSRPAYYLANINSFLPSTELPPCYIAHLLSGVASSIRNESLFIKQIFEYLDKVILIYEQNKLPVFPVTDDFDLGSWGDVLIEILRLTEGLLKVDTLDLSPYYGLVTRVYKVGSSFAPDNSIKEQEQAYSNRDYQSYSINSIYGLSIHVLILLIVSKAKKNKRINKDSANLVSAELNRKIVTAYAVVGYYYPSLFSSDTHYTSELKTWLFASVDAKLSIAAWEGYLWNNVYSDIAESLSQYYVVFLRQLEQEKQNTKDEDYLQRHVNHMVLIYVYGLYGAEALIKELLSSSVEIKQYAIEYIGHIVSSENNPSVDRISKDQLLELWENCLNQIDLEYFGSSFGWWVNTTFFKDKIPKIVDLLVKTVAKTNGKISPDFKILASLVELAEYFPTEISVVLKTMIEGKDEEKSFYFRDKEIEETLGIIEKSTNAEAKKNADAIRNYLVSLGYVNYLPN